jgi:integrase
MSVRVCLAGYKTALSAIPFLVFRGKKKGRLEWVGFHDFRHFRATQWIMRGVDIRSVQGLLGHSNIQTTERYVKFVGTHASKAVIEPQRLEDLEMSAQNWQQTGNIEKLQSDVSVN